MALREYIDAAQEAFDALGVEALRVETERDAAIKNVGDRDLTIADLRQKLADCQDNEPNPEPEPEPSTGALTVPGTGNVVFEDLLTEPNPSKVYGAQQSPWAAGYSANGQDDPYLPILTANPCPHVPVGKTQPTPRYRQHISKPDVVSKDDLARGTDHHTRTQTQKWSTSANPASRKPGKYVFYYSFRPPYSQLPHKQAQGGGIAKYSQVFQFKSHGSGGTWLGLWASVGSDGIKVIANDGGIQVIVTLPDRWNRVALVADYRDGGWFEIWSDVDGKMVKRTNRITGIQFMKGFPDFSPGLGPYHLLGFNNGDEGDRFEYRCDYTNFQICAYQGS